MPGEAGKLINLSKKSPAQVSPQTQRQTGSAIGLRTQQEVSPHFFFSFALGLFFSYLMARSSAKFGSLSLRSAINSFVGQIDRMGVFPVILA